MRPAWGMGHLLVVVGVAGFAGVTITRLPAMAHLFTTAAPYFTSMGERITLAGTTVTRLDMLPPRAASICEFLNEHGISEYFVDDSVHKESGPARHRTIEACWPRRQRQDAPDGFIDEARATSFADCAQKPLAGGVFHVHCQR